jgi:hypothetical protein
MKDQILSNIDNPAQLESLYREDKAAFKRAFALLYPERKDNNMIRFWNERLNFTREDISWGSHKDLLFVIIASMLAALIAKLPAIFHIDEAFFYSRNVGFIVFPMLSAYFMWKNKLSAGKAGFIACTALAGLIFINSLPDLKKSDTLILSCLHLLPFLWSLLGFAFVGEIRNNFDKRLDYLKYNGDLVVMTALILIAGGIMTGITIGLFSLIGFSIERFYFDYVVIVGLAAAPVVGTYLIRTNPQLVGKVSPVIARIFSPLVLVMLTTYLIAMIYSGKNPYNDREFLIIFNALLIGVMAIIFFSVAGTSQTSNRFGVWSVFLLSVVTVVVNGVALSAIIFRISEWGITPNRAEVLGSNVLILINLLLVASRLFKAVTRKADLSGIGKAIAYYLPIYFVWAAIVTFLFPIMFGYK